MIFTPEHCELILQLLKTMTRRLIKEGDRVRLSINGKILGVEDKNGRLKYVVGRTYSIRPSRTAKGIPGKRIRITDIRRERLQEISEEDAFAEVGNDIPYPIQFFSVIWDEINKKKGTRYDDNPSVWCLSFELVSE